ncbi:MAG: amidohydrolase family protein [Gimesia sp.]|nr:amidohydrolase family protein [Gimesia sp.]
MNKLLTIIFAFIFLTPNAYGQKKANITQIFIKNVKVFDGTSDQLKDGPVLIENNLIKAIGPQTTARQEAIIIDGKGGTLMPGLIDMHAHHAIHEGMLEGRNSYDQMAMGALTGQRLRDYLDQGFTTSRDAGGNVLGVAKAVRLKRIPGPRIFPSGGFISQVGGHADTGLITDKLGDRDILANSGFGHIVSGRAQVMEAVRHNLRAGATQIKVMAGGGVASEFDPLHMTQFTYDEMKAAVEVAKDYGTYVLVHAYHDRSVNRAIDAGVKCIEHNFLVSEKTIKRMKKEGVALSIQSVMSLEAFAPENVAAITFFSADQKAKAIKVNSGASRMLKWALKHDLIMVTGGDMFDAANVNRQIDNLLKLKDIGFSNVQILRTATSSAGHVLSWSGGMNPYKDAYPLLTEEEKTKKGIGLGVIGAGAYADLLVINGNPLENLAILKDRDNMRLIIKDGSIWKNTLVPAAHPNHVPSNKPHKPSGGL